MVLLEIEDLSLDRDFQVLNHSENRNAGVLNALGQGDHLQHLIVTKKFKPDP